MVKALLSNANINIDERNINDDVPLNIAVWKENKEIIK